MVQCGESVICSSFKFRAAEAGRQPRCRRRPVWTEVDNGQEVGRRYHKAAPAQAERRLNIP